MSKKLKSCLLTITTQRIIHFKNEADYNSQVKKIEQDLESIGLLIDDIEEDDYMEALGSVGDLDDCF